MSNTAQPNPHRFVKAAMRGRRFSLPEQLEGAYQKLGNDPALSGIKPSKVVEAVGLMPNAASSEAVVDFVKSKVLSGESTIGKMLQHLQQNAEPLPEGSYVGETPVRASYSSSPSSSSHTPSKPTSTIQRMTAQWEGLATEHKVSVGLSCLLAGLMAISSVTQFSHAVDTDAEGKRHVHASNIVMGGVSALLAAGMLYLTHAQVKGVMR